MYVVLREWMFTLEEGSRAFGAGAQTGVGGTWQSSVMWRELWEP